MQGRLLIACAAILWSTGGVAVKLTALSGPQIAGGRALFAALVLYVLLPSARGRWTKKVLLTATAYAATCVLFIFANTRTTAGNAIFIQNIAPVWVMLVAPFYLHEHASLAEKITLPISLCGVALFFVDTPTFGGTDGNLFALGASFSYAALLLSYRKLSTEEGLTATFCGNLIVIVCMAPFVFDGASPTSADWGVVIYLGVVQQAGAALLYVRGIREVRAVEGALLVYLEPVLSPIWAWLIVAERLTPLAMTGGILVVGAAVWRTWFHARAERHT